MQKIIIIFIGIWCIMCEVVAKVQTDYSFRSITALDGLPDNQTEGLFFTPDGRLGICTKVQICLYDGNRFLNYPHTFQQPYYWTRSNIPPYQYVDSQCRLWVKQRNMLHVFDLATESYIENVDSLIRDYGIKEHLANLFVDETKRIWFVTTGGLYCYEPDKCRLTDIPEKKGTRTKYGEIVGLNSIGDDCWIVYEKGYMCCWNTVKNQFVKEEQQFVGRVLPGDRVMMCPLDNNDCWMMWNRGVAYYHFRQDRWTEVKDIHLSERDMLTALETDEEGNAWVGSGLSGAYIIDHETFNVTNYYSIPLVDGNSIYNDITNIAVNKEDNGIWISFMFQGIAYSHPSMNKFPKYSIYPPRDRLTKENVRCMAETTHGDILLGTADGLYRFNPQTQRIDEPYQELKHKLCCTLYRDSHNRIWLGTMFDGLYCLEGKKVTQYYNPELHFHNFRNDANYNSVRGIVEAENGDFWVAIAGGVCLFCPGKGTFTLLSDSHPELLPYTHCVAMITDEKGQLIVGSNNGLYYYNPRQDFVWRPEVDAPNDRRFLHSNNKYNCIYRDSRNLYWFGTHNGLNIVDMQRGDIYYINATNGMPNSIVNTIVEDDRHDVWVSTANGLCKIVIYPKGEQYVFDVIGFNQYDGCLKGEYAFGSGLKAADGTVYLGGLGGFNAFIPASISYNTSGNKPVITGLQLFNTPILPGKEYNGRAILDKSVCYTRQIELDYDENFIALEFSGLNYVNPNQTYYRYKLEGLENQWNELPMFNNNGRAVYTGLPYGKYTFKVFAANNDKLWGNEGAELIIIIRPPFWDTTWARIFYLICLLVSIAGLVYYIDRRNKRHVEQLRQAEADRRKEELNQMKFRFFTNISHEFRTPLTLIITPLEAYIKSLSDATARQKLSSIYRHALDLLALVNQLLDFRKLEMGGEKLHLMNGDMVEFVRQVYLSFRELAMEKECTFGFDLPETENLFLYFDRDKMHKVLNNLLSNAFKFTPRGGTVTMEVRKTTGEDGRNYVQITVTDTGIGIEPSELPHIFERFYQVEKDLHSEKPGSGIGLHLIKEYVEMHDGSVSVESRCGKGTCFRVQIPTDLCPDDGKEELPTTDEEEPGNDIPQPVVAEKPLLLVVEDNREFRMFLHEQLSNAYRIIDAPDGAAGERLAIAENPVLIISDIMMPVMDGIELCRRIKTNLQTSHIPVILLTARTSDESKMMGYDAGADSYIPKPFSIDLLLTRVRKLIEQQQLRRETFHKEIVVTPSSITITSLDEQLVQKALACVESNMDNTEYAVDNLADDLAMTRTTLYRKLQGITGQTPKEFIRTIRLKRAAQLLQESGLSVAEVADRTGFATSRHFAKQFKDIFGVLPSQYDSASPDN